MTGHVLRVLLFVVLLLCAIGLVAWFMPVGVLRAPVWAPPPPPPFFEFLMALWLVLGLYASAASLGVSPYERSRYGWHLRQLVRRFFRLKRLADYDVHLLKSTWLYMLVPPWRHTGPEDERWRHRLTWVAGWVWVGAGMVLGALVAPSAIRLARLADTPSQDWLIIGMAVVVGFLVQFIGWVSLIVGVHVVEFVTEKVGWLLGLYDGDRVFQSDTFDMFQAVAFGVFLVLGAVLPLGGVGYGIYRYLTSVGADQKPVTIAFVGALLIKTFVIPFIKGIVTGALFKRLLDWLRGDKVKMRGA